MFKLTRTYKFLMYNDYASRLNLFLSNPYVENDKLFTLHCALRISYQGSRNRFLKTDCIKQLRSIWFKINNEITAKVINTTFDFEVPYPTAKLPITGIFKRTCGA